MNPSTPVHRAYPETPPLQRIAARRADIGAGFTVSRLLPTSERRMVGAWCFLDLAGPARIVDGGGMRTGPHPHIGLQTLTWMIEGEVMHHDSLGNAQFIRPGQVNLMTAGSGIAHSEESVGADGSALHLAQLWIALPQAERHRPPAFEHHAALPTAEVGGLRATVLAGSTLGLSAPTRVFSPLVGVDFAAPGPVEAVIPLEPRFEHALVCLSGAARLDDEPIVPGTMLYSLPGRARIALSCDAGSRLLLVGGAPFEEDVLIWWNFVARDRNEVVEAAADWNAGRRFGDVPGTQLARIPAPDIGGLRLKPGSPSTRR